MVQQYNFSHVPWQNFFFLLLTPVALHSIYAWLHKRQGTHVLMTSRFSMPLENYGPMSTRCTCKQSVTSSVKGLRWNLTFANCSGLEMSPEKTELSARLAPKSSVALINKWNCLIIYHIQINPSINSSSMNWLCNPGQESHVLIENLFHRLAKNFYFCACVHLIAKDSAVPKRLIAQNFCASVLSKEWRKQAPNSTVSSAIKLGPGQSANRTRAYVLRLYTTHGD